MKTILAFASLVALAAPLALAQTPITPRQQLPPAKAAKADKTAEQRAASYQGPKVIKNTEALGKKMVQKSKPTDMHMPLPVK